MHNKLLLVDASRSAAQPGLPERFPSSTLIWSDPAHGGSTVVEPYPVCLRCQCLNDFLDPDRLQPWAAYDLPATLFDGSILCWHPGEGCAGSPCRLST